ncbi:MAG: hypothetical protein GC180_04355 [Bacteroidetes bacterium]|nr:hypothetical protein [Bacteroidota bacterium]
MKRTFFLSVIFLSFSSAYAGWTVGYYPFPYSKVELTSPVEKMFYGGLRLQTNSFASNLNSDLYVAWNFKREERYQYFAGLGLRSNPGNSSQIYQGQFLMVGIRLYPIKNLPALGLIMDLSPYFHSDFKSGRMESNLGLFWRFGV